MNDFVRVLVTGSREWDDPKLVHEILNTHLNNFGSITVIHGDCPTGADLFARQWAEKMILGGMRGGVACVRHEPYPAPWTDLGKSAGPIRNAYMVNLGAYCCEAFPMINSRGTVSCMDLAAAKRIPVLNNGTLPSCR